MSEQYCRYSRNGTEYAKRRNAEISQLQNLRHYGHHYANSEQIKYGSDTLYARHV